MSKKRKACTLQEVSNLSDAFAVVEKLRKPVNLAKACAVLPQLSNFRPAKVLLASKVPHGIIDFDSCCIYGFCCSSNLLLLLLEVIDPCLCLPELCIIRNSRAKKFTNYNL